MRTPTRVETRMPQQGKVYLVGAGPGDPGLLTVKGLGCLQQADLVLYDRLVNPLLLQLAADPERGPVRAELASARHIGQQQINERLIAEARAGKIVVRLKGGDPFIFGRGREEAEALSAAGIDFEVVPGVTAAVAAGEYAGVSFTHRHQSSAVAFVTGHEGVAKEHSTLDYDALARFPGTLVFYMGLSRLQALVNALMAAGKAPETPACVISSATTASQKTVSASLHEIATAAEGASLRPPSIVVVGDCVEGRVPIAWYEHRPLFGRVVGITRPLGQSEPVIRQLLELGAEPVLLPTIEILAPEDWSAVDAAIAKLDSFDWLTFTSVNGVESFFRRLWESGYDARQLGRARIAVVGPSTAEALRLFGLRADLIPPQYQAESLADSLAAVTVGKKVLWARADRGRDALCKRLIAGGSIVETVTVYRNVDCRALPEAPLKRLERGEIDWIALGSPAIAESLFRLCTPQARSQLGKRTRLASISPLTAVKAEELGLPVAAEADESTWDGLIDAIVRAETR